MRRSIPLAFRIVPENVTSVPGAPVRVAASRLTVKIVSAKAAAENSPKATRRRPTIPTELFVLIII